MIKSLFLATSLLFSASVFANPVHDILAEPRLPDGADVAFLVVDLNNNKTLYSHRAHNLQSPASLQKLITALATRLYLPADYRFVTSVESNKDDVIFRFSGDPTFTRSHLRVMVERLKNEHSHIRGNLYLNGAVFDSSERAIGVPWDIMGICYSAPSSALTLNGNCVYGKLEAAQEGTPITAVTASAPQQIRLHAGDILFRNGLPQPNYTCDLKLSANDANHYSLDGCLETHRLPINFHLSIQNTTDYLQKILQEELDRAGITLSGKILRNDRVEGQQVIYQHQSAQLMQLIDKMVKDSDNLIADNLMKTLGHLYFELPGGFDNGSAAMKAILKQKANIDLGSAMLADGSGLSRNNQVSAEQLLQIVSYIFKNPELGLIQTMPVSGQSGTLRGRPSVSQEPLIGRVAAKTGAIYGTYNLAGRLQTSSGKSLAFVQIVSSYHPESPRNPRQPLRAFERRLYEALYNQH